MYAGGAKPKEGSLIAQLNAVIGDVEEVSEVWPEHWLAVQVFAALGTQWNVVQGGYVGLRYETLPMIFDTFGIKKNERAAIFASLRILEQEALSVINER